MLTYVPVRFDLYRPLKPHLRWTLQCLVGFADRAGKCWPSVRLLADVSGVSKSSVSRHLAELSRIGTISRTRRPGGVYSYTIDPRFLPAGAKDAAVSRADPEVSHVDAPVSHHRDPAVPLVRTEEKSSKKIKERIDSPTPVGAPRRPAQPPSPHPDQRRTSSNRDKNPPEYVFHDGQSPWEQRLRGWARSGGRFWPAYAGPRPDELGCGAPPDMIARAIAGVTAVPRHQP